MVDEAKRMATPFKEWTPVVVALVTLGFLVGTTLFGSGGFFSDTRGGISRLEEQQKSMDGRLQQIVDRLDRGPRVEQVQELYRVNAQQDGRMDAMREAYEKRIRDLELQYMEQKVRLDGIAAAGRNLSGR